LCKCLDKKMQTFFCLIQEQGCSCCSAQS
jgi:hypothetical protein